jgi:hypothetical protein
MKFASRRSEEWRRSAMPESPLDAYADRTPLIMRPIDIEINRRSSNSPPAQFPVRDCVDLDAPTASQTTAPLEKPCHPEPNSTRLAAIPRKDPGKPSVRGGSTRPTQSIWIYCVESILTEPPLRTSLHRQNILHGASSEGKRSLIPRSIENHGLNPPSFPNCLESYFKEFVQSLP